MEKIFVPFLYYTWTMFFVFVKGSIFIKNIPKNEWIFAMMSNIYEHPYLFSEAWSIVRFVHLKKHESYFTKFSKRSFVSKIAFWKRNVFIIEHKPSENFLYISEVANWEVRQFDIWFVFVCEVFSIQKRVRLQVNMNLSFLTWFVTLIVLSNKK